MQRMINEGFFLKLRWKSGLFLKLHWIFLSCNPVKTPKTPDSILKLRWTVQLDLRQGEWLRVVAVWGAWLAWVMNKG
jgi:hypothetical protein